MRFLSGIATQLGAIGSFSKEKLGSFLSLQKGLVKDDFTCKGSDRGVPLIPAPNFHSPAVSIATHLRMSKSLSKWRQGSWNRYEDSEPLALD